jgi:hypothetical protein
LWYFWLRRPVLLTDILGIHRLNTAEVADADHDRCIIPIKPENVDAWFD